MKEGGRIPDFVPEGVSNSTQQNDAMAKRKVYSKLGVREYFRYSPNSNRMDGMDGHRLVGKTLREGQWEALPRLEEDWTSSAVLGLELRVGQSVHFRLQRSPRTTGLLTAPLEPVDRLVSDLPHSSSTGRTLDLIIDISHMREDHAFQDTTHP